MIGDPRDALRSGLRPELLDQDPLTDDDIGKVYVVNPDRTAGRLMLNAEFLALDMAEIGEWYRINAFDVMWSEAKQRSQVESTVITQEWTTGWWLWKKKIQVRAEQVEMPPEYQGHAVTAKVAISVNGVPVHTANIPWGMPRGAVTLPLQVYFLAKEPRSRAPEWQPALERFALMCEGFTPPEHLGWTSAPTD